MPEPVKFNVGISMFSFIMNFVYNEFSFIMNLKFIIKYNQHIIYSYNTHEVNVFDYDTRMASTNRWIRDKDSDQPSIYLSLSHSPTLEDSLELQYVTGPNGWRCVYDGVSGQQTWRLPNNNASRRVVTCT